MTETTETNPEEEARALADEAYAYAMRQPEEKRTVDDWMALGDTREEAEQNVLAFGNKETVEKEFPGRKTSARTYGGGQFDIKEGNVWDDRASSYKPGRPAKGFLLFTPEQYDKALRAAVIRFRDRFPALPPKDSPDYNAGIERWHTVRDWVESPLVGRKQLAAKELEAARNGTATEEVKQAIQEAGLDLANLPPIDVQWTHYPQLTPENFAEYGGVPTS